MITTTNPLSEAREWYQRELHFAIDCHEYTEQLDTKVRGIFRAADGSPVAERYNEAAQLIACFRNTCGGALSVGHEHRTLTPEATS